MCNNYIYLIYIYINKIISILILQGYKINIMMEYYININILYIVYIYP